MGLTETVDEDEPSEEELDKVTNMAVDCNRVVFTVLSVQLSR